MSFTPPPRVKNALDNRKLSLTAPTPGVQGKTASLIWGVVSNNPRITVFTNDPNDQGSDKNYGKISANLDLPVFYAFLEKMREVIAHDGEIKFTFENKNFIFPGGKRSEKPVTTSELWFGKDKDGIVWVSITARDRPKIKFAFGLSDFHFLKNGDGSPVTPAQASVLAAMAYVRILENMVTNVAVDNYVEPPKREDKGGGGGYKKGGGNYGGGQGGGNGGGTGGFDDDMPF